MTGAASAAMLHGNVTHGAVRHHSGELVPGWVLLFHSLQTCKDVSTCLEECQKQPTLSISNFTWASKVYPSVMHAP